jgi:integrase
MPVYRDKARSRLVFEFDRQIGGERVRARKILPKAWTQGQADAFDRKESARLYAVATGLERAEHTIDAAVLIYIEERASTLKSKDNIERELNQMMPFYKGKPMSQLAGVCKEYRESAERDNEDDHRPLSAATLRNRIRYLTSACRYAWKRHGMSEHDPAERVIAPSVSNERHVFIDRLKMIQIARRCKDRPVRAAIRIAFYSGMRLGEIQRAEKKKGLFILADTKNGQRRHIPIHPKILCCIRYAMPNQTTIGKYFRLAVVAAKLPPMRFHDLRHSSASAMINEGIDLYTVGAVLGHKSATSTRRYAHLATDSLKDAINTIGRKSPHYPKTGKQKAA